MLCTRTGQIPIKGHTVYQDKQTNEPKGCSVGQTVTSARSTEWHLHPRQGRSGWQVKRRDYLRNRFSEGRGFPAPAEPPALPNSSSQSTVRGPLILCSAASETRPRLAGHPATPPPTPTAMASLCPCWVRGPTARLVRAVGAQRVSVG